MGGGNGLSRRARATKASSRDCQAPPVDGRSRGLFLLPTTLEIVVSIVDFRCRESEGVSEAFDLQYRGCWCRVGLSVEFPAPSPLKSSRRSRGLGRSLAGKSGSQTPTSSSPRIGGQSIKLGQPQRTANHRNPPNFPPSTPPSGTPPPATEPSFSVRSPV